MRATAWCCLAVVMGIVGCDDDSGESNECEANVVLGFEVVLRDPDARLPRTQQEFNRNALNTVASIPQEAYCRDWGCTPSLADALDPLLCVSGPEDWHAPIHIFENCGYTIIRSYPRNGPGVEVFDSNGALVAAQNAGDDEISGSGDFACTHFGWSFGQIPACEAGYLVSRNCYDPRFAPYGPDGFVDAAVVDGGSGSVGDGPVDN